MLALTSCAIPFSINLLESFPDAISDTFTLPVPDGRADLLPVLREPEGRVALPASPVPITDFAFPELNIPVPVSLDKESITSEILAASITYEVRVEALGPLSGQVNVQPYLGPGNVSRVAAPAFALGSVQNVTLGAGQTLRATVSLNAAQAKAVSSADVKFAIGVRARSVSLGAGGEPGIAYSVKALSFNVEKVAVVTDAYLPNPEGELLDFSTQDIPAGIGNLGLTYKVTLSTPADVGGTLSAQIYLAPPLEPGQSDADNPLYSGAYAFGKEQTLELAQGSLELEDSAILGAVEPDILRAKKLRVGVRVRGTPAVPLGKAIDTDYRFTELTLSGGYSWF